MMICIIVIISVVAVMMVIVVVVSHVREEWLRSGEYEDSTQQHDGHDDPPDSTVISQDEAGQDLDKNN